MTEERPQRRSPFDYQISNPNNWQPPVISAGSYQDIERRRREEAQKETEAQRKEREARDKNKKMFDEGMAELEALDGMKPVQDKIKEALALSKIFNAREKLNL